jgi:hypothetical protein
MEVATGGGGGGGGGCGQHFSAVDIEIRKFRRGSLLVKERPRASRVKCIAYYVAAHTGRYKLLEFTK